MKPITLHPVSVLAGVALVGLSLVLTGAAQVSLSTKRVLTPGVQLVGEIPAEWWTYVELRASDGMPPENFTIPLDRHFVVTKCTISQQDHVFADGQDMTAPLTGVNQISSNGTGNGTRVPLPQGALLTLDPYYSSGAANLWGYLEPVR